nr:MAG: RNA dependent RNA polymerase [Mitoviridae sp.]
MRNNRTIYKTIQTTCSKVVCKLVQLYGLLGIVPNSKHAHAVAQSLALWTSNEGKHGLDRFKSLSNFLSRRMIGIEAERPPHKVPRHFWALYKGAKEGKWATLYALSVLKLHRLVRLEPDRSTVTITGGFSGSWLKFLFCFGKQIWNFKSDRLGLTEMREFNLRWFTSSKSGPNGSPAWRKFVQDFQAVAADNVLSANLVKLFNLLPVKNREDIGTQWSNLVDSGKSPEPNGDFIHSRLAFLSDKAGKTRVVAIGDIYTQSLMKPIHDHLFSVLRKLSTDGTFDQDAMRQRIKAVTLSGKKVFCFDLSAATDRFPAVLTAWALFQCRVLSFEQAWCWWRVMTDREFISHGDRVRYSVGQPMGFLSSWGAFALSHHYVIQLCAAKVDDRYNGFKFEDYAVLGDDVAIWHPEVASHYLTLMKTLGVEISTSKSIIGEGVAEFAKVLFVRGEYWKPISPDLLNHQWDNIESNAISLSREFENLGISLDLYDYLGIYPSEKRLGIQRILLSPQNPTRSRFTGIPPVFPDDGWALDSWFLAEDIKSLSRGNLLDRAWRLRWDDPSGLTQEGFKTPFLQIITKVFYTNPLGYPYADLISCEIIVGPSWIAWDADRWIDHPSIRSQPGIPEREKRRFKQLKSRLTRFDRLLPIYLWPRCGDITRRL